MPEPYDSIVKEKFSTIFTGGITNSKLRQYYDSCFQTAIDHFGCYPCWICTKCLERKTPTGGWGTGPSVCPTCGAAFVYEVGTFQGRAPIVGQTFASAFSYLMLSTYRILLTPTPGNTRTHDFEIGPTIALETKGSPSTIALPNGCTMQLDRPGLERSDTRKKAFENARTFRQRNPNAYFCVVSNAVPSDLVGYRNRDVNAVFDVTKLDRISALIDEIGSLVDLSVLRTSWRV